MTQTTPQQTQALKIKRDKKKERAENRRPAAGQTSKNNNLGRHENMMSEMTADCPHQQNSKRDAESTTNAEKKKRTNEEKDGQEETRQEQARERNTTLERILQRTVGRPAHQECIKRGGMS